MMLGLLLARAGVEVVVLERHADFLRDFRGDTLHPSTLEVMHELGALDRLLSLPHQKVTKVTGHLGGVSVTVADFTGLRMRCPFVAFMPQWDFLDFLAREAERYPTFQLRMNADVTGLIEEAGSVVGVRSVTSDGPLDVHAALVVGADGRHSVVRPAAGLAREEFGAPMDVLWFRLPRHPGDPADPVGRLGAGQVLVMLNRDEYWQCGFLIPKGSRERLEGRGLPEFREAIAGLAPFAAGRVDTLREWDQVKLLTVRIDRLRRWYRPGLLCIGDAAHAMSPVGGVGINLAIQDAVAAANLLAAPLRAGRVAVADLARVQRRREWPARMTQRLQLAVQRRVIERALSGQQVVALRFAVRLLAWAPFLRRIPALAIGRGFRPEHVRTPPL